MNDEALFELFLADLDEQLKVFSSGLLELEQDPGNSSFFEALMRAAHSIKGASKVVGIHQVTQLSHVIEDCFVLAQKGSLELHSDHIDLILQALDIFETLKKEGLSSIPSWEKKHEKVLHSLQKKLEKISSQEEGSSPSFSPSVQSSQEAEHELSIPLAPPLLEDEDPAANLGELGMLDLFQADLQEQVKALSEGLLSLEQDPSLSKEYELLMRAAHSVKGASRVVRLDIITDMSHHIEDCFVLAQKGKLQLTSQHIDIFLQAVDILEDLHKQDANTLVTWVREKDRLVRGVTKVCIDISEGNSLKLHQTSAKQDSSAVNEALPSKKEYAEHELSIPLAPPLLEDEDPAANLGELGMLDLFQADLQEQVKALSEGLLSLEQDPSLSKEYEALMRAAHSVKGASRVVRLDIITDMSHHIEDCFVLAQKGKLQLTSQHIDIFLQAVDILEDLHKQDANTLVTWVREKDRLVRGVTKVCIDISEGNPLKLDKKISSPPAPAVEKVEKTESRQGINKKAQEEPKAPLEVEKDRVLRVSAQNLNKMMGLAGESLVESRWLPSFSDSLLGVKRKFQELIPIADKLRDSIDNISHNQRILAEIISLQDVISDCRKSLGERLSELELYSRRSSNLSDRLYREAIASRMRPFSDGTHGLPRMVRDIAKKLKKKVKFEIRGKETKVDRDILDKLEAPLNHILRNALDHGIETQEEREKSTKPLQASLILEARHQAGALMITVKDDGRGIDLERLKEKILEKGLASQEMVAQMNPKELIDFMFLPGFSTKEKVSEISGRGVGLDVVKSMLKEVSGGMHATTQLGEGSEFCLQLPLTLSVTSALSVEIAQEPYAFPLSKIDHALMVPKNKIKTIENHQFINIEGENIGLVLAHQVLEQQLPSIEEKTEIPVIVVSNHLKQYGIAVDKFLGEKDYVIQDLESKLGKIPNIYAGGLGEDGLPVLILDIEDMVTNVNRLLSEGKNLNKVRGLNKQKEGKKRILLVDDSITVREVEGQLLKDQGYEVDLAYDGKDGWNAVRVGNYDLVITDIDMPRMDGFELLSLIKSSKSLRHLPVIIVSYKDREEDKKQGIRLGANHYLTKESLHDNTLVEAVKNLLS